MTFITNRNGHPNAYAVIPAAGQASRFKASAENMDANKVLTLLRGKPVIRWTLEAFEDAPSIKGYVLVVAPQEIDVFRELLPAKDFPKLLTMLPGGETRQESVYRGMGWLFDLPEVFVDDLVLVHDGARPLVTFELVEHMVQELMKEPCGAGYARPVTDTLRAVHPKQQESAVIPRENFVLMQTPQGAPIGPLIAASRLAAERGEVLTDELQLLEAVGYPVRVLPGPEDNIKVTLASDLALCDYYLTKRLNS